MSYKKGARRERQLLKKFSESGFVGMRAPTSGGSTQRELPDILVGDGNEIYAIEVKSSSEEKVYIEKSEVDDLCIFSEAFGAQPLVAVKFDYYDWIIYPVDEMKETEKSYRVEKLKSPERGVEDIIQ